MFHTQPYPPPSQDKSCRLFIILLYILLFIGIATSFAFFIINIITSPAQNMEISVSSASLSQFSFNSSSPDEKLLTFNLLTNLTFRNPNKYYGINYDWLEVKVDYNGVWYSWTGLPVFYQRVKEEREVAVEFDGMSTFAGGGGNVTRVLQMNLWVLGQITFKY